MIYTFTRKQSTKFAQKSLTSDAQMTHTYIQVHTAMGNKWHGQNFFSNPTIHSPAPTLKYVHPEIDCEKEKMRENAVNRMRVQQQQCAVEIYLSGAGAIACCSINLKVLHNFYLFIPSLPPGQQQMTALFQL